MDVVKRYQRGFTLIEVMVVVVILGILAAFIVPKIIGRPDEAKVAKVRSDVQALQTAMDLYRLDNGRYPTTEQGLRALVERPTSEPVPTGWRTGGYIQKLNDDPWGRQYLYLNPGEHGEIDIFSYGAEGKAGGEGINTTIGNWSN
ncbi:MAG: type II secretion system major pseudopilin GspG [Pseudomonadota bacterium]|nr:type II secretion system major pseudopilin GspG [Pseudomonadota bacterium]